jgi:preprotein translocase subunit YajC
MWSDAFAQTGGAGATQANPGMAMLLQLAPMLIIFVILYLLLIRPQQQQQQKLKQMLGQLKKGDRVLTSGGIYGTVLGVDDTKAVLRIAEGQKEDVKVEFAKSAIVQVLAEGSR